MEGGRQSGQAERDRQEGQAERDRQNGIGRTGQANLNKQNRADRAGRQRMTDRTGLPEQASQERNAEIKLRGKDDSQDRTARTGQQNRTGKPGYNSHNMTSRSVVSDRQCGTGRTGQAHISENFKFFAMNRVSACLRDAKNSFFTY